VRLFSLVVLVPLCSLRIPFVVSSYLLG
jgi:hypothetical protein